MTTQPAPAQAFHYTGSPDPRFEVIRDMLSKRYHGVMDPITDEAVQAVLDELDTEDAEASR